MSPEYRDVSRAGRRVWITSLAIFLADLVTLGVIASQSMHVTNLLP